jgi:hypothetical protein
MTKVFEFEVHVGDGVTVGGLGVFPLTSVAVGGPPYLTGPEASEAGLIEVGELDPCRESAHSPKRPTPAGR